MNRTIIIEAMARTLIVESFASWAEETDEDDEAARARADAAGFFAILGADWMDTTPAMSEACRQEALLEAAILFGRLQQSLGRSPWLALYVYCDTGMPEEEEAKVYRDFGHYAVMSALGHGVSWEDSHEPLTKYGGEEWTVGDSGVDIESFDWDWADEINGMKE